MWSIRHDIDSTMNKEGKVKKRPLEVLGKCWRGFSSTPKVHPARPASTPDPTGKPCFGGLQGFKRREQLYCKPIKGPLYVISIK